jgi:hypothetical protein
MPSKRARNGRASHKAKQKHEQAVGALVREQVAAANQALRALWAQLNGIKNEVRRRAARDLALDTTARIMGAVVSVLASRASELEYEERKQQAERAKKPRLQPGILEAAQHYRQRNYKARAAWYAIKGAPYLTRQAEVVQIEGQDNEILKQKLFVISSTRTRKRRGISWEQWRQRYWTEAGSRRAG